MRKALATAIALSVIYPVLDDFYSKLFNRFEVIRRPGFAHVLSTIKSVYEAEKDPFALLSVLATLNPILQTFGELMIGYELYNRQPIVHWDDPSKVIINDYKKYLTKKIPMLSDMTRANEEEFTGGVGEFFKNQILDINTKSYQERAKERERAAIRKTSSKNREKEYEEEN